MKSKNITTLVLEGVDGVGKSTIIDRLFKHYDYKYMLYHRGELSNLVYANKFKRQFATTQVGLPFLHILLTANESTLQERIWFRSSDGQEAMEDFEKIKDQDAFIALAKLMKSNYHIIIHDTTGETVDETVKALVNEIDAYIESLETDENVSPWNTQYELGCKKLGLDFKVRDNQPYINDIAFMSELTCHNGVYETYTDKKYPDNLIFAYGYDKPVLEKKVYDFQYIINSKIKQRPEVYDYYQAMIDDNKTCQISESKLIKDNDCFIRIPRQFGNSFISTLSKSKATVYTSRDLEYLELQTARLYEAILANNIVFVDKYTDPQNKILSQIHSSIPIQYLLRVEPEDLIDSYNVVMKDKDLQKQILRNQHCWLNEQFELLHSKDFNHFIK